MNTYIVRGAQRARLSSHFYNVRRNEVLAQSSDLAGSGRPVIQSPAAVVPMDQRRYHSTMVNGINTMFSGKGGANPQCHWHQQPATASA